MSTLRQRRLGLLGVTSLLALVASSLVPLSASADPVPGADSDIQITKTWGSAGPLANGASNVATIKATRPLAAADPGQVYIVDWYDYGLTPTGSTGPVGSTCTNYPSPTGFGRMVCGPATIPTAGGIKTWTITYTANYVGPKKYTSNVKAGERIDVQKAETHVSIFPGETKTVSVECPVGYTMVDMSFVKQHVDQGTGTFDDVHVVTTDLIGAAKWSVTLTNEATGQAQGKLWAVCVQNTTNKASPVLFDVNQPASLLLHPLQPGLTRPIYAWCDPGETPVAIDVRAVADGAHPGGSLYTDVLIHKNGMEADGGTRVRVWITVNEPATVTMEWHCMKTGPFGSKRMHFDVVSDSKTVAHGVKDQIKLTCDHGYKGIIGGWMGGKTHGGKINGSEPQPVSRVYWFYNTTGGSKTYKPQLLCMRTRLVKGGSIDSTFKVPLVNVATGWTTLDAGVTTSWMPTAEATFDVYQ